MPKLSNKIALVTGSGQGVGQGIAYALAGEGATVAVLGRTAAKLDTTVTEIRRRGGKAIAVECDIKHADQLARAVERVVGELGGLDILVNNAQEVSLAPLLSLSEAALAAGWESGPLATLRLMKLCHPHLKKSGAGNIVNLCTVAAMRWDVSGYGGYAAVKEATRQLTRAAACEWAADGIRSNAILPLGDSPAMAGWTQARPQEAAAFIATVPMQRVGECEADIGRFVATLVSDDCRYINGQSIAVDGGQAFLG
ncbi:SDR family NAD(P)-dependent oxidoreductase [Hydrocarboniphaga sp.]|uniref:SDR family NAD(P)-dependent oxidoreductase n=1 Tax=Hydrocarboniphaga sp. TaxID=2033016 RepID=UPI003D09AF4D